MRRLYSTNLKWLLTNVIKRLATRVFVDMLIHWHYWIRARSCHLSPAHRDYQGKWAMERASRTERNDHAKLSAHTGSWQPNISTIFIGRSSADELEWRDMPTSAEPVLKRISSEKGIPQKEILGGLTEQDRVLFSFKPHTPTSDPLPMFGTLEL